MRVTLHAGSTLIEAIAVLVLTSILMAVMAGVLATQMRLARLAAEQVASAEAMRTTAAVLSAEIRRTTLTDIRGWSSDSLGLRGFRGAALPCGTTMSGTLVRYTGDRMPDAAKDSILIVARTSETSMALHSWFAAPGGCPTHPGEAVLELRTSGPIPTKGALLVFESGSYHLSTGALRYRIGAGGRQPLTIPVLRHPYSRFTAVTSRAVRFQIEAGQIRTRHAAAFIPPGAQP